MVHFRSKDEGGNSFQKVSGVGCQVSATEVDPSGRGNFFKGEPQIIEYRMSKCGIASLSLFLKSTEYIPSTFDIHYSIFDIRFFKVFISIGPVVFGRRQR
ncbi:hypothetical protein D1AOALGA4SA_7784 [Olavius algarvensis Delta 1 endosymbiont]|nr:hypothetical protein D1AOALGA4SA_7784 [Olavius algarvensis Delta 1 endosymbiont]